MLTTPRANNWWVKQRRDSLDTVAFSGAKGPEPGSGLLKFHCEGISVMLAPVSSLTPPDVVAVLSAAS